MGTHPAMQFCFRLLFVVALCHGAALGPLTRERREALVSEDVCPCLPRSECPRPFGSAPEDHLLGSFSPCKDREFVRCCGVSTSISVEHSASDAALNSAPTKSNSVPTGIVVPVPIHFPEYPDPRTSTSSPRYVEEPEYYDYWEYEDDSVDQKKDEERARESSTRVETLRGENIDEHVSQTSASQSDHLDYSSVNQPLVEAGVQTTVGAVNGGETSSSKGVESGSSEGSSSHVADSQVQEEAAKSASSHETMVNKHQETSTRQVTEKVTKETTNFEQTSSSSNTVQTNEQQNAVESSRGVETAVGAKDDSEYGNRLVVSDQQKSEQSVVKASENIEQSSHSTVETKTSTSENREDIGKTTNIAGAGLEVQEVNPEETAGFGQRLGSFSQKQSSSSMKQESSSLEENTSSNVQSVKIDASNLSDVVENVPVPVPTRRPVISIRRPVTNKGSVVNAQRQKVSSQRQSESTKKESSSFEENSSSNSQNVVTDTGNSVAGGVSSGDYLVATRPVTRGRRPASTRTDTQQKQSSQQQRSSSVKNTSSSSEKSTTSSSQNIGTSTQELLGDSVKSGTYLVPGRQVVGSRRLKSNRNNAINGQRQETSSKKESSSVKKESSSSEESSSSNSQNIVSTGLVEDGVSSGAYLVPGRQVVASARPLPSINNVISGQAQETSSKKESSSVKKESSSFEESSSSNSQNIVSTGLVEDGVSSGAYLVPGRQVVASTRLLPNINNVISGQTQETSSKKESSSVKKESSSSEESSSSSSQNIVSTGLVGDGVSSGAYLVPGRQVVASARPLPSINNVISGQAQETSSKKESSSVKKESSSFEENSSSSSQNIVAENVAENTLGSGGTYLVPGRQVVGSRRLVPYKNNVTQGKTQVTSSKKESSSVKKESSSTEENSSSKVEGITINTAAIPDDDKESEIVIAITRRPVIKRRRPINGRGNAVLGTGSQITSQKESHSSKKESSSSEEKTSSNSMQTVITGTTTVDAGSVGNFKEAEQKDSAIINRPLVSGSGLSGTTISKLTNTSTTQKTEMSSSTVTKEESSTSISSQTNLLTEREPVGIKVPPKPPQIIITEREPPTVKFPPKYPPITITEKLPAKPPPTIITTTVPDNGGKNEWHPTHSTYVPVLINAGYLRDRPTATGAVGLDPLSGVTHTDIWDANIVPELLPLSCGNVIFGERFRNGKTLVCDVPDGNVSPIFITGAGEKLPPSPEKVEGPPLPGAILPGGGSPTVIDNTKSSRPVFINRGGFGGSTLTKNTAVSESRSDESSKKTTTEESKVIDRQIPLRRRIPAGQFRQVGLPVQDRGQETVVISATRPNIDRGRLRYRRPLADQSAVGSRQFAQESAATSSSSSLQGSSLQELDANQKVTKSEFQVASSGEYDAMVEAEKRNSKFYLLPVAPVLPREQPLSPESTKTFGDRDLENLERGPGDAKIIEVLNEAPMSRTRINKKTMRNLSSAGRPRNEVGVLSIKRSEDNGADVEAAEFVIPTNDFREEEPFYNRNTRGTKPFNPEAKGSVTISADLLSKPGRVDVVGPIPTGFRDQAADTELKTDVHQLPVNDRVSF